jgi:hypothetical protein
MSDSIKLLMDELIIQKNTHSEIIRSAEKIIAHHKEKLSFLRKEIEEVRIRCQHSWALYAVGHHGSDKGTEYFECSLCGGKKRED